MITLKSRHRVDYMLPTGRYYARDEMEKALVEYNKDILDGRCLLDLGPRDYHTVDLRRVAAIVRKAYIDDEGILSFDVEPLETEQGKVLVTTWEAIQKQLSQPDVKVVEPVAVPRMTGDVNPDGHVTNIKWQSVTVDFNPRDPYADPDWDFILKIMAAKIAALEITIVAGLGQEHINSYMSVVESAQEIMFNDKEKAKYNEAMAYVTQMTDQMRKRHQSASAGMN